MQPGQISHFQVCNLICARVSCYFLTTEIPDLGGLHSHHRDFVTSHLRQLPQQMGSGGFLDWLGEQGLTLDAPMVYMVPAGQASNEILKIASTPEKSNIYWCSDSWSAVIAEVIAETGAQRPG